MIYKNIKDIKNLPKNYDIVSSTGVLIMRVNKEDISQEKKTQQRPQQKRRYTKQSSVMQLVNTIKNDIR